MRADNMRHNHVSFSLVNKSSFSLHLLIYKKTSDMLVTKLHKMFFFFQINKNLNFRHILEVFRQNNIRYSDTMTGKTAIAHYTRLSSSSKHLSQNDYECLIHPRQVFEDKISPPGRKLATNLAY